MFEFIIFSYYSRAGFLTFAAAACSSYKVKSNNYYRGLLDKVSYDLPYYLAFSFHYFSFYETFQMYDKGVEKIKTKIQADSPSNVSLQMDGWTAAHHGYMGGILGNTDIVNNRL